MASRMVNDAVASYRKMVKAQLRVEQLDRETVDLVGLLTSDEVTEYLRLTAEIDAVESDLMAMRDSGRYSESTLRQYASNLNRVGVDKS